MIDDVFYEWPRLGIINLFAVGRKILEIRQIDLLETFRRDFWHSKNFGIWFLDSLILTKFENPEHVRKDFILKIGMRRHKKKYHFLRIV